MINEFTMFSSISGLFSAEQMLLLLSILAGATHVLSPDHWMPTSLMAWQRGWSRARLYSFVTAAMTAHVALGFMLFLIFITALTPLTTDHLFLASLVLMIVFTATRSFRFAHINKIYEAGPRGRWAIVGALSLLGPCESIIPIFVKASQMSIHWSLPFAAFLGGTIVSAAVATSRGRYEWNHPLALPRWLAWSQSGMTAVPLAAGFAVGLTLLLRMPV